MVFIVINLFKKLFKKLYSIPYILYQEINILQSLTQHKIEKKNMEDDCVINLKDTQEFTFKQGHVINVYDACTIIIDSKLPYHGSVLYRITVILNGINTPKMRGALVSSEEKDAAKAAREFVHNLIFNKYIKLENIENDVYSRIYADVYFDNVLLNELLIKEGYAVPKSKGNPQSWLKYKLTGEFE